MDSQEAGGLIMGRRRGRRTRRRRKTGRHGGFGSPGKNPNKKKKKKVSRARKKLNKKIKSKTLKSKVKSVKKAVAKNKQKTKKKNRIKSIRSAIGDAVSKIKKGFSMGGDAYGKAFKSITRGAAAHASDTKKPKSKLRRQLSNLRSDIAQKSTKEARYNRRADRLKRQFGLDTRDMRNLKINVNVDQAAKHFGLDNNRYTRGLYNRLPKSIRNFRFNTELGGKFRSPHKLGVREGYRRPNRGRSIPRTIPRDLVPLPSPVNDMRYIPDRYKGKGPVKTILPIPRMGPEDWLGDFYNQYNIGGRGGNLDQRARDYWSKEAETKGRDAVMRTIFNTAKAEGTLGGAFGNPEWGMIKDTWTGPRGRKHYSFENTDKKIVQRPRPRIHGYPSKAKRARLKQNRAAQRSYDLQAKGYKRRRNMIANTIAATMAARGM